MFQEIGTDESQIFRNKVSKQPKNEKYCHKQLRNL